MMKKWMAIACLLLVTVVKAQKEKAEAYINSYKELAIAEMIRTGVPASIKLAQGILESGCGESDLAKTSNNHFGIKCKTEWTGARTYHDDDEKGECFRVYQSVEESYRDHSDFLKNRPYYADLFKLDPTDYEGWAKGLKKAGYATNPAYPQQLLKVINDYNLQQYSLEAIDRQKKATIAYKEEVNFTKSNPVQKTSSPETHSPVTHSPIIAVLNKQQPENPNPEPATQNPQPAATKAAAPSYPNGIFTINHSKVIYASAGTSLLSIASQFDIPLAKLIDYNELSEMDVLDTNRLLFIEKKMKRGATDYHMVAEGETLHAISQLEGVRLENLLEYNGLKKESVVSPGDRIYLRSFNTSASPSSAKPGQ